MKTTSIILSMFLAAVLMSGCSSLTNIYGNGKTITPSNVIISDTRPISNFSGIDMRTLGKVILSQGTSESLTIEGSDNIVPLVTSSVQNDILVLELNKNVNITTLNSENVLTFTIGVKNLKSLAVSGLSEVGMGSLTTTDFAINMSGAGQVKLDQLTADNVDITVTGLGNVEITGEVTQATINIPGAGNVNAPNLKIQTAHVTIPGLGNAVLWVTNSLTGNIGGGGNISYYGNPQTSIQTTGLGVFKALGNK
jgi:hypothetical protein